MKKQLTYGGGVVGVNRLTHVIHGVSVIQVGPALGHGLYVDFGTLQQVVELGNFLPMGVKSRFTHPGLSADGLGRFLGRVKGFYVDGDRVRADLYFADASAKSPYGDLREYIESLAETDASAFGMSVVYRPNEPYQQGGKAFIRLAALLAVDVVDEPAANRDGLFSAALVGTNQLAERAFMEADKLGLGGGIRLKEWLSAGTLVKNLPSELVSLGSGYDVLRLIDVANCYVAARSKGMNDDMVVDGEWPGVQLQQEIDALREQLAARVAQERAALDRVAFLEKEARQNHLSSLIVGWPGDKAVHLAVLNQLDESNMAAYVNLMRGLMEQLNSSALMTNIGTSRPVPASSGDLLESLARARVAEKGLTYEAAYAAVLLENPKLYKGGA